jgi:hypothetical protein
MAELVASCALLAGMGWLPVRVHAVQVEQWNARFFAHYQRHQP